MKYTNDLKCHNGKWYAQIEFVGSDTIPAGCLTSDLRSFNVTCGAVSARGYFAYSNTLYAPIKVPEGFPEKWTVLKDGDIISEKTFYFEDNGDFLRCGHHIYGEFSDVCKVHSTWNSVIMFNPVTTPQENFANAEKSGIVDAFKNGKTIQSSRDGKNWSDEPTPNFCSPLQWRVKRDPIKPPVFDWRPIEECDLTTKVLVKTKHGDVVTAKRVQDGWYCEYTSCYVYPNYFTVTE